MYQQQIMQGGIGGLGGGLDSAFNPLKQMLSNSIAKEQVDPFVEQVKRMAQERFNIQGDMSNISGMRPQPTMTFSGNQPRPMPKVPTDLSGNKSPNAMARINAFEGRPLDAMPGSPFDNYNLGSGSGPGGMITTRDLMGMRGFGMKDGGEVMDSPMSAGLGSFLASNIDEFGRNGDTEMIHATREEVVMPRGMMEDPEIRETIRQAFERTGRDMTEYTVGSGEMNVNPFTGYEEAFDLIKGIKNIFKKAAPILLPAAVSFLFPGMAPVLSGAIAGGVGSLLTGGDLKDALKGAALGGLSSSLTSYATRGNFGFQGDPSIDTGRFGLRKFGDGSGADLGGKLSGVKDFFVEPQQTVDQLAKSAGIDLSTASEGVKKTLTEQALQSGGLNLGRAIPAGLGIMALAGGFDPIEEDPLDEPYDNTSRELVDMYPERYTSGRIVAPRRRTLEDILRESNPDYPPIEMYAKAGGEAFPRRMGAISGPGTGTSDDVPAMLSDGEFVMTAQAVRGAGNGSRKEGVKKMYDMMKAFEGGAVA